MTLIKKTETELDLAKDTYPSNITLSLDHSNNVAKLVTDTFFHQVIPLNNIVIIREQWQLF